jgi:protein SCO1/2
MPEGSDAERTGSGAGVVRRRWIALLAAAVVVAAGTTGAIVVSRDRPPEFYGAVTDPPRRVADLAFTPTPGQTIHLSDFRGKLLVIYFGYTRCPDVCPTAMSTIAEAMRRLGPQATQVQVAIVTVDPERDTPAVLQRYVSRFDPRFVGLTGAQDEIAAAAQDFGVYAAREPGPSAGYVIGHTAAASVIDRQRRIRVVFFEGMGAEEIASDLRRLLASQTG